MCKIIVKWFSGDRIGNNLVQLKCAILYATEYHCNVHFSSKPKILKKDFIPIEKSCQCDKIKLNADFWPTHIKYNFPNLTFDEQREFYKTFVLPHLSFNFEQPKSNSLYIHIRSGLNHSQRANSTYYLQPPLAYYKKIINDGNYNDIYVVYQNDGNPCVNALKKAYPNATFISNDGFSDFTELCKAENLVIGYGTFGLGVVQISPNVKKLYVPDYVYTTMMKSLKTTHFEIIKINLPNYVYTRKIPNLANHMIKYKIN